jgi:hypothetical protein
VFVITHDAMNNVTSPDEGTPPKFLPWFTGVTFVLFSSFAVVYLGIHRGDPARDAVADIWYDMMSMVSKTTLHLFIGLSTIGQSGALGTSEATAKPMDNTATLRIGLGVAAGIFLAAVIYAGFQIHALSKPPAALAIRGPLL